MSTEILINTRPTETRVAVVENQTLVDFLIEKNRQKGLVGSIYRGKVIRVLPGMQSAFVDIGLDRAAFLYVGDVHSEKDIQEGLYLDDEEAPEITHPPIQELLTEGQALLVQVAKDPLGTKGARITTHLSLPGRYVVYLPTLNHLGISRRIEGEKERDQLKKMLEKVKPKQGGLILRTVAEQANEESIRADITYLENLYDEIHKKYNKTKNTSADSQRN